MVEAFQTNEQTLDQIDTNSPEGKQLLGNLQANILKAHGRDEAYHIFFRFTGAPNDVKAWIKEYPQKYVTSALKQHEDAEKRSQNPNYSGGLLGCFFLSAAGYTYLGFDVADFADASFKDGLNSGNGGEIHAMLLLAQNRGEDRKLDDVENEISGSLGDNATVLSVEKGGQLPDSKEHFGYRDGISNPLLPQALLLVEDPYAIDDLCYGSYFVFQKLKQDVNGFDEQVKVLAEKIHEGNEELARAQIVGRFRDGTPLTTFATPQDEYPASNDFTFEDDDGSRCPVHAHIRKANPRNDRVDGHRIVRRGIPYGKQGDAEVGLLFMCYQSSIQNQFEFIQRAWINNPDFPTDNTGTDPLIGLDNNVPQQWPKEYGNPNPVNKHPFNFGGHVTLKGGEYFFAPSLNFLEEIVNTKYALFFVTNRQLTSKDNVPLKERGIRKVFQYSNMYVCILNQKELEREDDFTVAEFKQFLTDKELKELPIMEATSRVKTEQIIKPIVEEIVEPGVIFNWMLLPLSKLEWLDEDMVIAQQTLKGLTEAVEGASGGSNG